MTSVRECIQRTVHAVQAELEDIALTMDAIGARLAELEDAGRGINGLASVCRAQSQALQASALALRKEAHDVEKELMGTRVTHSIVERVNTQHAADVIAAKGAA